MENYLKDLDATPQSEYSLWRAARNLNRPVIWKPSLRNLNGSWARNDNEKGNLFVNHLKNVFTPNISHDIADELPLVNVRAAFPLRFQMREIEKAIRELNTKMAPGIDKISNKMLMELPCIAKKIILEYYPQELKVSLVIMIPKPGKDHTKVSHIGILA